MKVLALSDIIKDGVPLLAANFRKQRKNVVAVSSATKSKWRVRVTQQVNNAKYDLTISPVLDLTNNGPAKSIPTFENGVDCLAMLLRVGI